MPRIVRVVVALLCLAPLGCLEALQRANESAKAERRSEGIADACQRGDVTKLEEYLKYEPDAKNHLAATRCLVDVRMNALVSAKCETFSEAFVGHDEVEKDGVKTSRRKALVDFANRLNDLPKDDVEKHTRAIADKAWACHDNVVLFTPASNALVRDREWNPIFAELDKKESGAVLDRMMELMREDRPAQPIDVRRVDGWIRETKPTSRCKDLEAASRATDGDMRRYLLQFFLGAACKTEALTVASEQLTSKLPEARMEACLAFGSLKDRSRLTEMRRLAATDPARSLGSERLGHLTYAFVTYPVRESCQQTLNELELGK